MNRVFKLETRKNLLGFFLLFLFSFLTMFNYHINSLIYHFFLLKVFGEAVFDRVNSSFVCLLKDLLTLCV